MCFLIHIELVGTRYKWHFVAHPVLSLGLAIATGTKFEARICQTSRNCVSQTLLEIAVHQCSFLITEKARAILLRGNFLNIEYFKPSLSSTL